MTFSYVLEKAVRAKIWACNFQQACPRAFFVDWYDFRYFQFFRECTLFKRVIYHHCQHTRKHVRWIYIDNVFYISNMEWGFKRLNFVENFEKLDQKTPFQSIWWIRGLNWYLLRLKLNLTNKNCTFWDYGKNWTKNGSIENLKLSLF